jgi:arylsulfatase A-like enzyme
VIRALRGLELVCWTAVIAAKASLTRGCALTRLASTLALLLVLGCAPAQAPPERIILIVVDTLRLDHVSAYGGEAARTPNIDALAASGHAHPGFSASFHQTSMSMAALFTGRTPSLEAGDRARPLGWNGRTWCGLARFARPGEAGCVPRQLPTLAARLREAGYWTAGVVTNRLLFRPAGFDRGFDRWIELPDPDTVAAEPGGRDAIRLTPAREVNRAAQGVVTSAPSDRFFLYLHYMDVHDHLLWRKSYKAMVEGLDMEIGRFMEGLEVMGLLEDAVVVLVSDHGERFDETHFVRGGPKHNGNPSFEEVLRVPLIVTPASASPQADWLRGDDLHHHILDLAGAAGKGPRDLEPGELFLSELKWQTYRRGRWKSYQPRVRGALRLVDLDADPGEAHNVASEHPDVVAAHNARMRSLTKQLASGHRSTEGLDEADRRRLKALGYLE